MNAENIADSEGNDLPTTPAVLLARLSALGLAHETVTHEAVFTVEQSTAVRARLPVLQQGVHIKNLFLRNKREEMWLVTAEAHRPIDLKQLGERIGAGRVSFGSPERLMRYLGVRPGSVTPLALINDTAHRVRLAVDRAVLDADIVWAHPLVNTMATRLSGADLRRFFTATGHTPAAIDFVA
ncbi:prolyl-tRNA synthetase associated domain-containing protein [Vineibacter terrae]|uniref:prolyl-tRNA synthetase associated domain-containing protein n=1 Tax=Vineibacter terrae TaxID=2586908 RepID=UPI002E305724|nr:prolyl-tRNA synthetase associated domain-containing protein [Vineibacter terrae]HEX2890589.1 prolyl-tRNA synthetase associated domain-containing protein [Vineibacter terrae]